MRERLLGRCACRLPFGKGLAQTWKPDQTESPHQASTGLHNPHPHPVASACPVFPPGGSQLPPEG